MTPNIKQRFKNKNHHQTNVYLPLHPGQVLLLLFVCHELLVWCCGLQVLLHLHLLDPQTQESLQHLRRRRRSKECGSPETNPSRPGSGDTD